MQFFFDHLIASVVTLTLGLSLIAQQTTVRQDNMERLSIYQAKGQSLSFAEWVEDDVVKLGARFGTSRNRFDRETAYETSATGGHLYTSLFDYYYNETVDGDEVSRVEVRYEVAQYDSLLTSIDELAADSTYTPLYELTRSQRKGSYSLATEDWIGTAPTWAVTSGYQSPSGLRHFHIIPLDSNGQAVEPAQADYVRLQFEVLPTLFPLYHARLIPNRPLHWSTTIEIRPF